MSEAIAERVERYFDGKPKCIWDDFYYEWFDGHPYKEQPVALAQVLLNTLLELRGWLPWAYKLDSISGGIRAWEIAAELGLPTIKNIDRYIGSLRARDEIIAKNAMINFARTRIAYERFPGYAVLEPCGLESVTRKFSEDPRISSKLRWEEENFMSFWFPVIDNCLAMIMDGDWNYSRNGILEMFRGVIVQAGLHPDRPKTDMDVLDINGRHITLIARAEKLAEFIAYAIPRGLNTREAATALARMLILDDWLRHPDRSEGLIDPHRLHPILKNRNQRELSRFDRLRRDLAPVLKNICAENMKCDVHVQRFLDSVEGNANPALLKKYAPDTQKLAAYFDLSASYDNRSGKKAFAQLGQRLYPYKPYDVHQDLFATETRARIFDDVWHERPGISERERAFVPILLAASETVLILAESEAVVYIAADRKAGGIAQSAAREKGVVAISELPGALGVEFESRVIEPNRFYTDLAQNIMLEAFPNAHIVSARNFERIFAFAARHPAAIAQEGDATLGPEARIALRHKFFDRNVTDFVFQTGWETSPDLANDMVRATLLQCALVPRPFDMSLPVRVWSWDGTKMLSLADRIHALGAYVEACMKEGVEVPEQATALARLLDIHDRLVEPEYNNHLIDTGRVHPSLLAYDREKLNETRTYLRGILLGDAARYIRTSGLSPDYEEAQRRLLRDDALNRQRTVKSELLGWGNGPVN